MNRTNLTMETTQEAVKERVDIVLDVCVKARKQVNTATKHLLVLGAHLGFRS
jgi:hypothetical protein